MSFASNLIKGYWQFFLLGGRILKKKKALQESEQTAAKRKKRKIPYQYLVIGAAAFAYFFCMEKEVVYATTIWVKAEAIMKDVYGKIVGISTITAIVTASVALLLMNFSKSGKTVDEARAWLKRIVICWATLNSLGFIMAYVTPFFTGGKWTGK